jgi:hypothetical protein
LGLSWKAGRSFMAHSLCARVHQGKATLKIAKNGIGCLVISNLLIQKQVLLILETSYSPTQVMQILKDVSLSFQYSLDNQSESGQTGYFRLQGIAATCPNYGKCPFDNEHVCPVFEGKVFTTPQSATKIHLKYFSVWKNIRIILMIFVCAFIILLAAEKLGLLQHFESSSLPSVIVVVVILLLAIHFYFQNLEINQTKRWIIDLLQVKV